MFDLKELELILAGLDLLEDDIEPDMPDLSGLVAADSAEDARRIISSQIREAQASEREKTRHVILLKAKVVQLQMEGEQRERIVNTPWMKDLRGMTGGAGGKL